jgi:prepilin-type N-terminal cleavage/methylation domain-containing protein
MSLTALKQRGDTIVEVMIVLAVLGLAIGISYSTANRSLLNTRQAQEHSQATEYAQSEVEDLYALYPIGTIANADLGNNIFEQIAPFCVYNPSAAEPIIAFDSLAPVTDQASCTFPPGGSGLYYTVKVYNCDNLPSPPAGSPCNDPSITTASDTFAVQVTWPDVLGQGNDSVTLDYRVHQPS